MSIYAQGLDKCAANYTPLSPISFLKRSAAVYPEYPAIIDGERQLNWGEVARRCSKLASALGKIGVGKNDTVAILAPNSIAIFEAHFAIPMAAAVLNAINTRLDAATIAYILNHGQAKVFIVDSEFAAVAREALQWVDPIVGENMTVIECAVAGVDSALPLEVASLEYESFLQSGDDAGADSGTADSVDANAAAAGNDAAGVWNLPEDEWDAIALNYTSGTTGKPKGVVYHHRGAYLNALSNAIGWEMRHHPVYLWTLPMFHCNGWCFPWTLAALAGVSVCLREVNSKAIYDAIADHRVSHFCGAPIVMGMVINAPDDARREFDHSVNMMTAAAPPPAAVLQAMEAQGFNVTHVYGLTETYGPAVICAWKARWDDLGGQAKADVKSRQGVNYHALEDLDIMRVDSVAGESVAGESVQGDFMQADFMQGESMQGDFMQADFMQSVARNGEMMGEVMFRGNIVMKGYLSNPDATAAAFAGGWFHSGDLGVVHADNYIQLKDRSKDIIISGGENISSIEVENCLYSHADIQDAAVVAKPDDKWGESPCAFVDLVAGASLTAQDVIDYCRDNLAHYKAPRFVVFQELPKTSTGKVQKFKLRELAIKAG